MKKRLAGDCDYERACAIGGGSASALPGQKAADIAQIFFTSGSTGLPKGVCLTHGNLTTSALDAVARLDLNDKDVWLHAAPMFHLVDAFAIWGISSVGGRHLAVHFEPSAFGSLVEQAGVTKTSLPPTLLDWIARLNPGEHHDLGSLDRISYGGSPMQEAVYRRCRQALGCRMIQAYGLTEGSGFVCHERLEDNPDPAEVINTVGVPTAHVEVRIDDPRGPDQVGELVIRGPRVFSEYWRDPEATKAAFASEWFHTGDLASQDAAGRFRIVGRRKEMIISGGENVYPAEVVNALLSHPAVIEAAVFGLPSERWGEEVSAVVYAGSDLSRPPTPDELIDHCRNLIGGYKTPKRIAIADQPLPKTGAGKIATAAIRQARAEEKVQ